MKKRIILGDIHGHFEFVQEIYNREHPNDVIILGDYCDSFKKTPDEIEACWDGLVEMKSNHKNGEFHLLIGNHDLHYMITSEQYSGKNWRTEHQMHDKLMNAWDNGILEDYFIDEKNKTIYSHAGITKTWVNDYKFNLGDKVDLGMLRFTFGNSFSCTGDDPANGFVWVRPYSLYKDRIDEYTQIVGHTVTSEPVIISDEGRRIDYQDIEEAKNHGVIYIIDTLPFFYMVEKIDNNGNLVSRDIKKFMEFEATYRQ